MGTFSRVLAIAVVLTVWFLAVLAAGSAGAFQSAPSQPPLPILVALAVPPLLFAVVYRAVPGFRRFVLASLEAFARRIATEAKPPAPAPAPAAAEPEVVIPPRSELIGETAFPGMVTESGDLVIVGNR